MKLGFVLLALTALFQGNFIVAQDVSVTKIPYHVELWSSKHHHCSGALFRNLSMVITAHCVFSEMNGIPDQAVAVIAGRTNITTRKISYVYSLTRHFFIVMLSEPFPDSEEFSVLNTPTQSSSVIFGNKTEFDVSLKWSTENLQHEKIPERIPNEYQNLRPPNYCAHELLTQVLYVHFCKQFDLTNSMASYGETRSKFRGCMDPDICETNYNNARLQLTILKDCDQLKNVTDPRLYFCATVSEDPFVNEEFEIDIGTALSFNGELIGLVSQRKGFIYLVLDMFKFDWYP